MALALSGETSLAHFNKVTVINTVGVLNLTNHTPIIRNLSFDESADPSVRLSSIFALGIIGEKQDMDLLTTLTYSGSPFRHAAKSAIKNLNHKIMRLGK